MALKKVTKLDKIEIIMTDAGWPIIQIRHATWVEDAKKIVGGKQFHRYTVSPDTDLSAESADVQAVGAMIFTDEIKSLYTAAQAVPE